MRQNYILKVNSPNVKYTEDAIISTYRYETTETHLKQHDGNRILTVTPKVTTYTFKTSTKVPKLGLMLVGWGGNNGSTVTGGIIANAKKMTWETKNGTQHANYFGSITQCSTIRIGSNSQGKDIYIPLNNILPMVDPNKIVIGGWDISKMNLGDALKRAAVFDYDLMRQLIPLMKDMVPLPGIYDPDFIASNQEERADNVLQGTKYEQIEQVRQHIRDFKKNNKLDKVIVLWTANTERCTEFIPGVNDTAENLLDAIKRNEKEIAPSTMYAVAAILEGCSFINGSPQNTLVPGVVQLAKQKKVFVAGDDFKSGQTKLKSVLVDFLVSAGLKPKAIVSYNHLGNNDGKNLSAPEQFRSKEISKSNVIDDMIESNPILYGYKEGVDHTVVIKYVPYVGDSKRAMDEYTSQIFMGGHNTLVIHNTCEDSLLAAPIIIDLVILTELFERIKWKTGDMKEFESFHPVLSVLSYLFKAPMVPENTPVVNALFKQKLCLENILRACVGLPPENHMHLEHKCFIPKN